MTEARALQRTTPRGTAITCICAPDAETEQVAVRTLSIGCTNAWKDRGIPFAWDGGPRGFLPYDDDSFREIYACADCETFSAEEAQRFAGEAWRVLNAGGRFEVHGPARAFDSLRDDKRLKVLRWEPARRSLSTRKGAACARQ